MRLAFSHGRTASSTVFHVLRCGQTRSDDALGLYAIAYSLLGLW